MTSIERKQELIKRILDRTPYLESATCRQRLAKKLCAKLTKDDLYILAQATKIPETGEVVEEICRERF